MRGNFVSHQCTIGEGGEGGEYNFLENKNIIRKIRVECHQNYIFFVKTGWRRIKNQI
jgi:hypothetical protein